MSYDLSVEKSDLETCRKKKTYGALLDRQNNGLQNIIPDLFFIGTREAFLPLEKL